MAAAKTFNEKKKHLIISGWPKEVVEPLIKGNQKLAERKFCGFTGYTIYPNPADPDRQLVKWESEYGPELKTETEFGKIQNTIYFVKSPQIPTKSQNKSEIARDRKDRGIDDLEDFIQHKFPKLITE